MIGWLSSTLLAGSLFVTAPEEPLRGLFQEGITAYNAQDFAGAIAAWEKLGQFRVESAAVEYNLGNAYFKTKQYGRAVLHWRRSLRLDPDDEEARKNLNLAAEVLVDDVPPVELPLEAVAERARRFLSLEQTSLAVIVAWESLGLALLLVVLGSGQGRVRRVALSVVGVAAVILVALVPLLVLELRVSLNRDRAVVLAPVVEVRSGPGEQYTTVFTVHEGLVARERESTSGWVRIELANGLSGWVNQSLAERI